VPYSWPGPLAFAQEYGTSAFYASPKQNIPGIYTTALAACVMKCCLHLS